MNEAVSYGRRVSQLAAEDPDGVHLIFSPTVGEDEQVDWRELDLRSNQVARLLLERGVGVDDVVIVGIKNSIEHFLTTFGIWKVGGCVVPLRWDLPTWEHERLLEVAAPKAIVAEWDDSEQPIIHLSEIKASTSYSDEPLPDVTPPRAGGIASSGSTGRPKIIINPQPGSIVPGQDVPMTGVSGVQLIPTALYHTNGFSSYIWLLRGDETLVVMEKFDAAKVVDLVERYKVNTFIAVPTMLQRLARLEGVHDRDWSSVRSVQHGGAAIPEWLARFWIDLLGPEKFFMSYGSTERVGLCQVHGDEWLEHPGTVGHGYNDTEIQILDADKNPLPPGEIGEIFMRMPRQEGPAFEYVGAPQPPQTADGFTSIGDLGWLDEDGYLFIADRRVDMIVSGGANVFPAEVEAALTEHPGVHDVCVVGLSDPEWGRRVHAVVQAADPANPPTVEELTAHCRERLATYKRPKTYEFVDALPRSDAGKINRGRVMAEREEAAAASSARTVRGMELRQVARDVYACLQEDRGLGYSNSGLVNRGGGLVVDTFWDLPHTREMIGLYGEVWDGPAARVVNSHANGDHYWGNQLFPDAEIIGHRLGAEQFGGPGAETLLRRLQARQTLGEGLTPAQRWMAEQAVEWDFTDIELRPPDHLIDDRLDLDLDGVPVAIISVGPAHTESDVIVHLPEHGVVFTGDVLFRLCTPIGWAGTFERWEAALDLIVALGPEVIVPGHGPLCGVEGAVELKAYLAYVQSEAKVGFDRGWTVMETARAMDLGPYASWTEPHRLVFNVDRAYRELQGIPWDAPVDTASLVVASYELWQDRH